MDGREGMSLQGPGGYYMQQRGGVPGSGTGSGSGGPPPGMHSSPGFRPLSNPHHIPVQPNMGGSAFEIESSSAISHHGMNVSVPTGLQSGEPVKRKRGRPRKYGPDSNVALALSPLSSSPTPAQASISPGQRRGRGRPPGTGRKQQLASLGEWISSSAGMGFTPHVITIAMGEDIATKIMSFSQQGPRAVCILSANGAVSAVTLRQPSTSGGTVTYELGALGHLTGIPGLYLRLGKFLQAVIGHPWNPSLGRFEILCLSGSYMLTDNEGSRSRTGGLSVSLSNPDGRVIGGGVGGMLIAASPVQVIVGSFLYGGSKSKNKAGTNPESGADSDLPTADTSATPSSVPMQTVPPASAVRDWPIDMRNALHVDIDLTRG